MGVLDELSPEMVAFALYLRRGDALAGSAEIADVRDATKKLRDEVGRKLANVEIIEESRYKGMRYRTYQGTKDSGAPTVVYLHGGAWSHLDIDVYDPILRQLAANGPMKVIGLDYPLVPEVRFPENLNACVDFVRHVLDREPDGSVILMGDSAGANLAIGAALMLRDGSTSRLSGLGLIYGVFDLENERESAARYGGGELPMTTDGVRASQAFYLGDAGDPGNPLISPIKADLEGLPPVFLSVASHDNLYDENLEMARRLGYAGVAVELKIYPGAIHGFLEAWSVTGSSVAKGALEDLARFAKSLGGG